MQRNHAMLVLVGLASFAACDKTAPAGPTPAPPPPPPGIAGLRIEGPDSVAPGATAALHVIASLDNGTTSDITSQVVLQTSNAAVLILESRGVVKGVSRGEAVVFAASAKASGQLRIFVLEDGTYRLIGRVRESGIGVPGVRVAVVAGTGTGLSATTDADGSYALYGVAGEVRIEAARNGFRTETRTIAVGGHTTADLDLRPAGFPIDVQGTWRMTLTGSSACSPPVPEDAASRTFTATITQAGTALEVQFAAPGLLTERFRSRGIVLDRTVTIFLPVEDFYYPFYRQWDYSLADRIAPNRLVAYGGTLRGVGDGSAVSGTLDGEVSIFNGPYTTADRLEVSCRRPDHIFRMER